MALAFTLTFNDSFRQKNIIKVGLIHRMTAIVLDFYKKNNARVNKRKYKITIFYSPPKLNPVDL
jgi:hypothetical protein